MLYCIVPAIDVTVVIDRLDGVHKSGVSDANAADGYVCSALNGVTVGLIPPSEAVACCVANESGTSVADVAEVVMPILVKVPGPNWLNEAIGVLTGSTVFGPVVDPNSTNFVDRMAE